MPKHACNSCSSWPEATAAVPWSSHITRCRSSRSRQPKPTELISAAYASSLDDLIKRQGPRLWIHGHIHETRDYLIGETRILNNSLGYQTTTDPEKTGIKPDLVAEV